MDLFPNQIVDGVEIIPLEDVPRAARGWSEESMAKFRIWLRDTGTAYYARPRESFNRAEAIRITKGLGRSRLILEDLS